ncbi:MAG TPA: hypothetical protein VMZ06_01425 [Candidatus Bathyarchaeia archaeon]|nr:hypothetical protein [Candidatus Bathyarchaeia archaeon]
MKYSIKVWVFVGNMGWFWSNGMMRIWILAALALIALGCATGKPVPEPGTAPTPGAPAPQTTEPRPAVTLDLDAPILLGDLVSTLADTTGGSLVVMNGLEYVSIPPRNWKKTPFERVVKDVASPANLKVEENPYYVFLYFPGYEALESVSLEGRLDPAFAAITASVGFGYRTKVFEALAFMSSSLGITLLADQVIGDAQLGALNLAESPLDVCLAALLKSARVPAEAFDVESTPEYVFLHAKSNTPRETLLNPLELTAAQTEFLNQKVTAVLPSTPINISRVGKLGDALPALSRQIGVEMTAQPGLGQLPVEPGVFRDVKVRTLLDLMIRQWPVAEFGYRVEGNGIVIQRRP